MPTSRHELAAEVDGPEAGLAEVAGLAAGMIAGEPAAGVAAGFGRVAEAGPVEAGSAEEEPAGEVALVAAEQGMA